MSILGNFKCPCFNSFYFILVDLSKYFDLQSEFYKLKIKVRSPTGQRLAYKSENQSSFTKLKIIPKEKGKHRISIKLGNHHIKSLSLFRFFLISSNHNFKF